MPSVLAALGVAGQRDPLGLTGTLAGMDKVIVLLVDGMGWHNLPEDPIRTPTLHAITAGGLGAARPMTTGFPSTTPTSLVSLGTGARPGEHGVLGFTVNVPGTDRILVHTHWPDDPVPELWQPVEVLFRAAGRAGVNTAIVNYPEFASSGLTRVSTGVSGYRGASGADALAAELLATIARTPGPAVVYGYHSDLDQAGHRHGITSMRWWDAAVGVDRLVTALVEGLPYGTALVITADHGQLDVPADRRIDLDTDPRLRAGLRVAAGEPRVRYLHTLPGATADVADAWRGVLGAAGWVLTRDEAIDEGLFGPVPAAHRDRIGDLVVICADDWAILATEREPAEIARLVAFHGALTEAEMTIPLITITS
ncbi:hypothetical protein F4553_002772 [Allocatelliglobosispora scoriae]|uniref:Alkaline phosphatase family protein n=2 Tax=Allocatelliglobosispora scoriae TaxID=643052 RepID=A0A841BR55_9ACTN|nr:hypothetical protein [Allocatelliglobosispora scoriae]